MYNLAAQTVPIESDISFDSTGVITPGIQHAAGATAITLVNVGTYKVSFSVSGTQANQIALFRNGSVVTGATYGSGAGTQQNNGQTIIDASAGDVLTLRNHSSAAALGLAATIGGTQATVNASVTIEKLS